MKTPLPLGMTSYSKPDGLVVRVLSFSVMCSIRFVMRPGDVLDTYYRV